jgi:subtilisin family serine protease
MKRVVYPFLVLLFVSCGSNSTTTLSSDSSKSDASQQISSPKVSVQSVLSNMERGRYREGELLVKFKSGVVAVSSLKTHQALGAVSLKRFALVPNLDHVRLPEGLSVKDAIIKYMEDPSVEYAEPNYIKRISTMPNDPLFSQQWGLTKINAPGAWDITTGNSGVIVAVIDSGIALNHPDLIANIGPGFNFITNTNVPTDDNGHGTHVSGVVGAVGNNGIGVAGVMWNVKLMPLKFLDANGEGFITDEISAIEFAITHGAKIMNASFAGPDFSRSEYDEIKRADTLGVLLMAAAGNETANNDTIPSYPASFSNPTDPNLVKNGLSAVANVISVAATNQSDSLASFSNFGLNSVHVAAPGLSILSTIPFNLLPCTFHPFDPNYDYCSGTSQATPFVSGLAGLLYSYYANFTYSQVRGTILRYVDVLGLNIMTGGRINAYKALSSLLTPTNLSASAISQGQISLTWTDNATGEDGYKIERKTGAGSFSQIATTGSNTTATLSFTDNSLDGGTTYTYRVRAFNSLPNPPGSASIEGNSSFSNEASATTLAPTPTPTPTPTPAPTPAPSSGGGGGGCSIGARQNAPSALADSLVMLTPLLLVAMLRRRK